MNSPECISNLHFSLDLVEQRFELVHVRLLRRPLNS